MMPIREVAQRSGLRPSAIRYYERIGLLPAPPRASGRRAYGEDVLVRLAVIRYARETGFQLREIATLLGGRPYSSRMRRMAQEKFRELQISIDRARTMQALLAAALRCRCLTVEECGRRIRKAAPARS